MYRIKFDGKYVKECSYEYLVKCKKEESTFSESMAQSIKKQCPERIELENDKKVPVDFWDKFDKNGKHIIVEGEE